jgi:hypothetical protein
MPRLAVGSLYILLRGLDIPLQTRDERVSDLRGKSCEAMRSAARASAKMPLCGSLRLHAEVLHRIQQLRIDPRQPRQGLRIQPIVFLAALPDQAHLRINMSGHDVR